MRPLPGPAGPEFPYLRRTWRSVRKPFGKHVRGRLKHMDARDTTLHILRNALPDLRQRFSVRSLRLFGSMARAEAGPESDVDLLVEFSKPVGLFLLSGLREHLMELLDRHVDVGTEKSLRPRMRATAVAEAIRVA